MGQTKNKARDKLYKKGHILPKFNTLVVIVERVPAKF